MKNKEEILERSFGARFTELFGQWAKDQWLHAAMEDYAKEVLKWLLEKNHPDHEGERIIMEDGSLWWDSDKDGDYELGPEEIIKLYENDTQRSI